MALKQNYSTGDIINVDLGKTPYEVKGHEQANKRPCIIIKSFNTLNLAIIIPCTTKEPKHSIYTIVKLLKGTGGLDADSYALCHQIRTISYDRILHKIGKLDNTSLLKVQSVILDTLDISS